MSSTGFNQVKQQVVAEKPTAAFMDGRKPLDVIIVGGSHSGLFVGILLKRQGHNIRILERATSSSRSGLAAGIGLGAWVKRFFDEHDRLHDLPLGVPNEEFNVLDLDLKTVRQIPLGYRMTTWDATYYRLRANFDGLVSGYCPNPPSTDPEEGEGICERGINVLRVDEGEIGRMRVLTEGASTKEQQTYDADVVIGADGANSTLRWQLQPSLKRQEPGYLLWRGTIPTKDLSKEALDIFDGRTTQCPMKQSYTIVYSIPGDNGNLEPAERHINFAWYSWPSDVNLTIQEIMTDKTGHLHHTTMPKGAISPEIWSRQLAHAKATLPALLYELASKIAEPLVSLIATICAPQAAYFDNRLFLIGDALCQLQPNTGQGTTFAAMDAMLLADVFKGELSPEDWNRRVVEESLKEQKRAVEFARGFLGESPAERT